MRNKLIIASLALVVVIGAFLVGCSKKENPYSPNASLTGCFTASDTARPNVAWIQDLSGDHTLFHTPTYDEIIVMFDREVTNVNTSTILVQNVENFASTVNYTVTYEPGTKKAVIVAPAGWTDAISYLVTVTTGVRDLNGKALDGNGNDLVDPQDYFRVQFWGATSTVGAYDLAGPTLFSIYPGDNTTQFSLTDSLIVVIADADSVDPTTLTAANFTLTTDAGTAVTLPAPGVYETVVPQKRYSIRFRNLGLVQATNYIFTVTTGIKDEKGNTFDGDGDGNSEQEMEDKRVVKFRTYDPNNGAFPSLQVANVSFINNNNDLMIRFNRKMDVTTLTSSNIKLYADAGKTAYIPGTIRIQPDTFGVEYSLENLPVGTNYLWVSRLVKDKAGYMLDFNGNGIGGEAAWTVHNNTFKTSDDFWGSIGINPGLHHILLDDNVENGTGGFSPQRLWHRTTRKASPLYNGQYSWHCGVDADSSYLVAGPTAVHDTLFLPALDLSYYANASLNFSFWSRTDGAADAIRLLSSIDNGTTWNVLGTTSGNHNFWENFMAGYSAPVAITTGPGYITRLAIAFDTDNAGNIYPSEGPYFDNIRIEAW